MSREHEEEGGFELRELTGVDIDSWDLPEYVLLRMIGDLHNPDLTWDVAIGSSWQAEDQEWDRLFSWCRWPTQEVQSDRIDATMRAEWAGDAARDCALLALEQRYGEDPIRRFLSGDCGDGDETNEEWLDRKLTEEPAPLHSRPDNLDADPVGWLYAAIHNRTFEAVRPGESRLLPILDVLSACKPLRVKWVPEWRLTPSYWFPENSNPEQLRRLIGHLRHGFSEALRPAEKRSAGWSRGHTLEDLYLTSKDLDHRLNRWWVIPSPSIRKRRGKAAAGLRKIRWAIVGAAAITMEEHFGKEPAASAG